jgi:hypothetical protein
MLSVASLLAVASMAIADSSEATPREDRPSGTLLPAPRTVVLEEFTGTWCPPCTEASLALKEIESEYSRSELAIVEYHFGYGGQGDPYEPKDSTSQERYDFYGGQANVGAPGAVFDGDSKNVINGASSVAEAKAKYKARIDAHLNVPAPVEVVAVAAYSGSAASLTLAANPVGPLNRTDVVLRGTLVEDIGASHQGHWIGWVARATVLSEPKALTQSVSATAAFSLDPSWKTERLAVVAYVQDAQDKTILQGRFEPLKQGNGSDTQPPGIAAVSHSPPAPTDIEKVRVSATVTDNVAVASASVEYDAGGGAKSAVLASSGSSYSAEIGPFAEGTTVRYQVEAKDAAGNGATSPDYSFTVSKAPQADATPPTVSTPRLSPSSPASGDPVTLSAIVKDDVALSTVVLSFTDSAGAHSVPMSRGAGDLHSATIGPFAAGESVVAKVDAEDTSGNAASSTGVSFKVLQGVLRADLGVDPGDVTLSLDPPVIGKQVVVTVTVTNHGPSSASRVIVLLEADGAKLGEATIGAIAPGSMGSASLGWTPSGAGEVVLRATADPAELQPDPDRGNNVAVVTVQVKAAPAGWLGSVDWTFLGLIATALGATAAAAGLGLRFRRRRRARRAGYDARYPVGMY